MSSQASTNQPLMVEQAVNTNPPLPRSIVSIMLMLIVVLLGVFMLFPTKAQEQPDNTLVSANRIQLTDSPSTATHSELLWATVGIAKPETLSPQEANRRLALLAFDAVINKHNLAVANLLFTNMEIEPRFIVARYRFSNLVYKVQNTIVDRDMVAVHWIAQSTLDTKTWNGVTIWQIVDGKIVSEWVYSNADLP